ncbi:MAG: beta-galactosidase, partial [Candidatus Eremiobacteraeota bacterium]|nr:beta-galactosidase [Candidatus Eremiobacteraeota bacterium]
MQHALGRRVISGEIHYPRVPPEYWRHRLRMAAAMGLDTVSTYVFWNVHEPEPEQYQFAGAYDVREFLRIARAEGLHVILRPGPYVCAEWDFGGLPAWLLRSEAMRVRTADPEYLTPVRRWLQRLGEELAQPLRDGTVIAVQLENEYGALNADSAYLAALRDIYDECGFGALPLYTIDQPSDLAAGSVDGIPCGVTFAPGYARDAFHALRKVRPAQLPFCGEFWAGWFDHWGEPHEIRNDEEQADDLEWMLSQDASVNFYMIFGGTNFGFLNGANYADDAPYRPDTTSYDYLAAIDEAGRPRDKFYRFRDIMAQYRAVQPREVPPVPQTIAIPEFALDERADALSLLGEPVSSEKPLTMEAIGQNFGYVLYRAELQGPIDGMLTVEDVRDYAVVTLNGSLAGHLDRRTGETTVPLRALTGKVVLEILVENSGRINYGTRFADERKGICGAVRLDGQKVTGWECHAMPMDDLTPLRFAGGNAGPMAFARGFFELNTPADTFL